MDLIYRVDRRGSALALPQKWRGFKSISPFAFPPKPNHDPPKRLHFHTLWFPRSSILEFNF